MLTFTTDEYKMERENNDEVEGNVEFNSVTNSNDIIINNNQYLPPLILVHRCFN